MGLEVDAMIVLSLATNKPSETGGGGYAVDGKISGHYKKRESLGIVTTKFNKEACLM